MLRLVWVAAVFSILAVPANAGDCEAPCVGATLSIELMDELVFAADPGFLKMNSLQPEAEVESFLAVSEVFRLVARHTLSQVIDPEPGESSTFSGLGLVTSELYGELTLNPLTLRAGKFAPVFSRVNEVADVLKASDLAGNADMDESLGFGLALDLGGARLEHRLVATAFTMDRSFFAGSLFSERPIPELSDGGIGNTSGLSSFSLVLDGCAGDTPEDCYEDGRFGYRLGARYQRVGVATRWDEWAGLAAAHVNFEIDEERALRLIGEAGVVHHFEGGPADALIATAIAALVDGPITYSAALSRQWTVDPGSQDTAQSLAELSLKYAPEDSGPFPQSSWSLQAGYVLAVDEDDHIDHMLGTTIAFELGVSHSFD